jgi:hypothetical protein
MPIVPRPLKAAGTNSYQGEVAAGKLDIIDAEVDLDFTTIYNLVNGKLDNLNLDPGGVKITYDKLNLTGRIVDSDIVNVSGAKIIAGTIPGSALISVAGQPIITSVNQLGVGVTVVAAVSSSTATTQALGTDERLMREVAWTSRGGTVFVIGAIAGRIASLGADLPVQATIRSDGTAGVPTDGTPIASARQLAAGAVTPLGLTVFVLGPAAAGARRMKLTANTQAGAPAGTADAFTATLAAVEFA